MRIGAHESVAGGVSQAFARAVEHQAKSLQIFTKSARGWNAPPLSEDERKAFRREAKRTGLPSIAHASYLVNLGSDDPVVRQRSVDCLTEELTRCERLGVGQLIVHPGAHPDEARGLTLVAEALDDVHARTEGFRAQVCLEGTAGQGNSLGWRFEQLAGILARVRAPKRVGICLDTCHLFAAGYDLSTEEGYAETFESFDRLVGLRRLRSFHLNDSKKPLGCRVDRHEEIGKGALGLSPFKRLVNDSRFADTIAVLETPFPERYRESIALLESLVER